jgi:hypothetical protein
MLKSELQEVEGKERLNWEEETGVEDFGKPAGVTPKAQDHPSSLDILPFDILRFALPQFAFSRPSSFYILRFYLRHSAVRSSTFCGSLHKGMQATC